MALNYSLSPIYSTPCMADDNMVHGGSQENDICDILPADPSEMDISSTLTAITGWLEYLAVSNYGGYRGVEGRVNSGQYSVSGGWDLWSPYIGLNKTVHTSFRSDRLDALGGIPRYGCCTYGCSGGGSCVDGKRNAPSYKHMDGGFGEFVTKVEVGYYFGGNRAYNCCGTVNDAVFERGDTSIGGEESREVRGVVDETGDESPHPALSFALAHLGVRDLLAVERVCKSLQFTVQNDSLMWRSIQVDFPLNSRINDDILVNLCSRAQGQLQCLSLLDCKLVKNDGLRLVLESNPRLFKLSIAGCKNLEFAGVLDCLKAFQSKAVTGIKYIRVDGLAISPEQYHELVSLIGDCNHVQLDNQKPHFFRRGAIDSSCDDDRAIDVELCPKCKMVKLVYDCTTESCQGKEQSAHLCRACIQCIKRCYQCGRCIDNVVHEEDFFLDYVCSDCSPTKLKWQDGDIAESSSSGGVFCELDG
ncbi:hypothetical protein vseg_002133 [Gypsophila vaccaria]